MGFLFGGGSKVKPAYTGLQTQTSTNSLPIPLAWGKVRIAPNIIWQGDFQSHKHKQSGKGFGKVTSYTYSASFELGLCWGEITAVSHVWKDQSDQTSYAALGFSLFTGTTPQSPWGYLTTAHPTEALGYPGIALLAAQNYDMGQNNTIGQHSFEVEAPLYNTQVGGAGDADPALVIQDFLTNATYGAGFNGARLGNLLSTVDATTTGDRAAQTYWQAIGWGISPCLVSLEAGSAIIQRWCDILNIAPVWTGSVLKLIPYATDTITGNGVTYLPDFVSRYTLTDDDFVSAVDADPVIFDEKDMSQVDSQISFSINNRANQYNELPIPWHDQGLIDQYGPRSNNSFTAKEVAVPAMAEQMVFLYGNRQAYTRHVYKWTLGPAYVLLEPMDVVTLVDSKMGTITVLISEIEEDESGDLHFTAEEWASSVYSLGVNASQAPSNVPLNTAAAAGPVNAPILFEPPSTLAGTPQIWAAVSGGNGTTADPNWGGANVWISTDNVTYTQIGTITKPARMGKTTALLPVGADPDSVHTLAVTTLESGGELLSANSAADAAAGSTIAYVGIGATYELIAPQTATLTGTDTYNLTNLSRGLNGSTIASHASGSDFARLDDAIFKYALPAAYIGVTLYLKFQSFNIFNDGTQDLSVCTAYTVAATGFGYGTSTGGVPAAPTAVTAVGGKETATVNWAANSLNDNVTDYLVYRAAGPGGSFGSAVLVGTVNARTFTDVGLSASTTYTYFVRASNVVGPGPNSAGVDVTTSATAILSPIYVPSFYLPDAMNNYVAPTNMIYHKAAEPCTIRANLAGWQFGATANATGSTVFTIKKALAASPNTFTTIGTITIGAGTIVPTFSTVGGLSYSLAVGDELYCVGPGVQDLTLADPHVTALLDRT